MVNATGSVGYQSFAAQPAIAAADPPAQPETVQPRQAPAADSQKTSSEAAPPPPPPPPPPQQASDSQRGANVNVTA